MATRVPTRLTPRAGRRFGLTVGGAFLALAALLWWRAHPAAAVVLGALGAALVAAGLILPTRLGPVERAWMALAYAISQVTTPIVMATIYFVVVTPFGWARRTIGRNPLVHHEINGGFWRARPEGGRRSASMERQF